MTGFVDVLLRALILAAQAVAVGGAIVVSPLSTSPPATVPTGPTGPTTRTPFSGWRPTRRWPIFAPPTAG